MSEREFAKRPPPRRRGLLLLVLALAIVRGIVYLAIFPPWQYYDEPTHFEYVRLIAERGRLPRVGEYDLEMRREIASSMQAREFWRHLGGPPVDLLSREPPPIGISELQHPPFYYTLFALPQLLVAYQTVETQLYLARMGSIVLFVLVVLAAYGLVAELLPGRKMLALSVATFVALLPPLTQQMSSVNNDAGAAAAVSLLLWALVRLFRRGPSVKAVVTILLLAGLSLATKKTASAVAVACLIASGISYFPRDRRRWLGAGIGVLFALALVAIFSWDDHAAYWQSFDRHAAANRQETDAILGRYALVLSADGEEFPRTVSQELSLFDAKRLRGRVATVGFWLKSVGNREGMVILRLDDGRVEHRHVAPVTSDWQFQTFTAPVASEALTVMLSATLLVGEGLTQMIYLDGITVVQGGRAPVPPEFETPAGKAGTWGSQQFANLVRNGSAEKGWPGLQSWIGNRKISRQPTSQVLYSLLDLERTSWVYPKALVILLRTFWLAFGWNHIALPTVYLYPLGAVAFAGILSSGIGLLRWARSLGEKAAWKWRALLVLGVALVVGWGATLLRIHPVYVTYGVQWPVARYASVVIGPTALLLCFGLAELVPHRWVPEAAWLGLLGMLALDAIAVGTLILPYYYG